MGIAWGGVLSIPDRLLTTGQRAIEQGGEAGVLADVGQLVNVNTILNTILR